MMALARCEQLPRHFAANNAAGLGPQRANNNRDAFSLPRKRCGGLGARP